MSNSRQAYIMMYIIIAACIIHKNSQSDRKKVLTGGNYRKL